MNIENHCNCSATNERLIRVEQTAERIERGMKALTVDVHEIHQAVKGDSSIGLNGLVKDNTECKRWRSSVDLRVATISGGISAAVVIVTLLVKFLFHV